MIVKLQSGDKIKIESDEKREARKKYKEYSLLSIGLKLKRNLNIASNFLKSGPNITNFGNAVSALFGGFTPENPDLTKGDPPAVGIKNFENLVRTARVAREFNDVVKGPVNLFRLLNNFVEKFVTNPKGSGKLVHYDKGNGKSIYQENRGASIVNGKLIPGKTKREGLKNYTWWNTDNPYLNVHKAKEGPLSPTRYIVVDGNAQFKHPFDLKEPVGQSAGKGRGFILPTERVTDKPVDLTNAEIYEKSPFGWWERIKVLPTSEITKSKPYIGNRYKREDVLIGDEWGADLYTYPEYIKYRISKLKQIVPDKIKDYTVPKLDPKEVNLKKSLLISRDNFIRNNIGFNPMAIMSMGKNLKTHLWEINRRLSKLYPDLPEYATEGINNAENTPFIIGYFNEPNIVGFHSLTRGINLVEPSPKSNLPRTMLHEGVMHGTDSYMTKTIANAYLLFINKIYLSPYIENGIYIKNNWPYKAPEGANRWEEGRATFGEIRKFLYDKISKDNNILFSPENMDRLIPIFEKTVDELNINDVVDLFNKTGGYGEVYGTIGPKANSNFLKDSKDLLKYMPATIPFLIPRKEEKK